MSKEASFIVELTLGGRRQLQAMVDTGQGAKQTRRRARVLLEAD